MTMTEQEPSQSSRPEEAIEVRIVEGYSAADRSELAGEENDPGQTSAYQLQWRPTEKHVVVVAGGKAVVLSGSSDQRWKFRRFPCPSRGLAEFWCGEDAEAADIAAWQWGRRRPSQWARCV
jgi:hypothetical protein